MDLSGVGLRERQVALAQSLRAAAYALEDATTRDDVASVLVDAKETLEALDDLFYDLRLTEPADPT